MVVPKHKRRLLILEQKMTQKPLTGNSLVFAYDPDIVSRWRGYDPQLVVEAIKPEVSDGK